MKTNNLFLILAVCLASAVTAAPAYYPGSNSTAVAAGWSTPAVIYAEEWDDPLFFSLDDGATRMVALIPNSGSDDNSRPIVVSEYAGGAWQPPVTIAQNGSYSYEQVQWLPQETHPVISGDGNTIAYVGYTGTTFGVYIVNRLPGGGWNTPQLLNTGLANTHYWISLSRDGNTLALCDYPFWDTQQVFVLTRNSGVWSAPQPIGTGGDPSLSPDGKKLTYVSNARLAFAEQILGQWTTPQELTDNDFSEFSVEFPQMSGDGRAIHYWLVTLVPEDSALIRTAQDLYILRREGSEWSAPQKVNSTPVEPTFRTEGPAAADNYAMRLVYSRPVTTTETLEGSIDQSELEMSEWMTGTWQTTRLVEATGYNNFNAWPCLTPDGKTLVFDGGARNVDDSPVYNALWQMTTETAPPLSPWDCSATGIIEPAGGSLFSGCDSIGYLFGSGTFTGTVEFTHSTWPDPPPPPPGMGGIGGIGGIGGLGGAFSATLFGPGGLPVQPTLPVTVTVNYSSTNTGPTIPGTLGLWWWNGGLWNPLTSMDNSAQGVLTTTVSHFSNFAVFGETHQLFLPGVFR